MNSEMLFFDGNDYPRDDVEQQARAPCEREQDPNQANNGGVNVKVFSDTAANTAEDFVFGGTIQAFSRGHTTLFRMRVY